MFLRSMTLRTRRCEYNITYCAHHYDMTVVPFRREDSCNYVIVKAFTIQYCIRITYRVIAIDASHDISQDVSKFCKNNDIINLNFKVLCTF